MNQIPTDCIIELLKFLPRNELLKTRLISKQWESLATCQTLWKSTLYENFEIQLNTNVFEKFSSISRYIPKLKHKCQALNKKHAGISLQVHEFMFYVGCESFKSHKLAVILSALFKLKQTDSVRVGISYEISMVMRLSKFCSLVVIDQENSLFEKERNKIHLVGIAPFHKKNFKPYLYFQQMETDGPKKKVKLKSTKLFREVKDVFTKYDKNMLVYEWHSPDEEDGGWIATFFNASFRWFNNYYFLTFYDSKTKCLTVITGIRKEMVW